MKNWKSKTILFLISQCITLFGSTLVQMAIVWYVIIRSSSGTWIAAFTICSYVPQFLISFVGGVLADKYSKKILIIVSDAGIAIVTFIMMLLIPYISNDSVLLSSLLIMSVIRSFGSGIQTPAVNAVIPTLVPEEHLMRFNGINATMQSIVQFAAPAAAGVLLTFSSLQYSLLVDVITAAMGIGLLSAVAIPKCVVTADVSGKEQAVSTAVEQAAVNEGDKISVGVSKSHSAFDDMKNGLHYAFSNKIIGSLLIVYGLFIFLGVPAGFLSQLLVSRVYGNTYWYLTATELVGFAGMALGGIVMGVWGGFKSRVKTLLWGLSAFGLLACGMGLSKHFIIYLCFMLIYGIALTMVQTATTTLIQEKTEESMQGRVFGLLGTMYSGFLPIGMLLCGPLADRISLQVMMIVSGIALLLIALVMRLNKSFRD